ncbi:MAG: hypothetical protein M5U08_07580 [Burkholderiales bacterium]|nr:hypothetical protein [Burkholderiales bacterium]
MSILPTAPKFALVLVQPGPTAGWGVLLPGAVVSELFRERAQALSFAKAWASAHRPATMHVSGVGGNFTHEWSFR